MVTTRSAKAASIASPTPSGRPPKSPYSKKAASVASGVSSKKSGGKKKGQSSISVAVRDSTALDLDDEDDFEYSDNDDSIAVASSTRSAKSNQSTTSSKRTRLPANVEKALLTDIIERGGRKNFDGGFTQGLCALCDAPHRKKLWGPRGSDLRKKIGPRVQYYKNLPEEKWKKLIGPDGYNIKVSRASLKKASVKKEFPTEVNQGDLSAVSDLDDESESEDLPDKIASAPDIVPSSVPVTVPSFVPEAAPSSVPEPSEKQPSNASLLSRGYSSATIKKTEPTTMSRKYCFI